MSLTSYRAAPSRDRMFGLLRGALLEAGSVLASCQRECGMFFTRSGGDLLSHVLRRSTISATALNGRVRNGIGCFARAMATRPRKEHLRWPTARGAARGRYGLSRRLGGGHHISRPAPVGGAVFQVVVHFLFRVCFRIQPCCFWIGSSLSDH